jgi:hypothetical protein
MFSGYLYVNQMILIAPLKKTLFRIIDIVYVFNSITWEMTLTINI